MDKKPVILVVDDTPENLDVVKGILLGDYTIRIATNGPMALKIVEKQTIDLILLDIMMPEMDGYEVCERLKSNSETSDIPVLFLTAKTQTEDETKGLALGAADYLLKPVSPPILKARVKTHLMIKQQMDQLQVAFEVIENQKDRMQKELNVGREIQLGMVPQDFPAFPDRGDIDIFALLRPALEIGGDFYDFFFISDHQICICVGDVSGKGVPAALFMAVTKTLVKANSIGDDSTASIVTRVNEEVSANNPSFMFITLFFAIFDISKGTLTYTNAGHNPSFIKRVDGVVERLETIHGPVVGAIEDCAYSEDTVSISAGDRIIAYTDGITEAINPQMELFSEERLIELLENEYSSVEDLVDCVVKAVDTYAGEEDQFDDITILAIELKQDPDKVVLESWSVEMANKLEEIQDVISGFEKYAGGIGLPELFINSLNMVFDELLANIVSYGYKDDKDHRILIKLEYSEGRLVLNIEDDGIPFNPFAQASVDTTLGLEERDIGGLGIHLVKNIMDETDYQRQSGKNIITLTKRT